MTEKKQKKAKKGKKKKSSKRHREEDDVDNNSNKKKKRMENNETEKTIYEQLNEDPDNQLWLVRVPKTLNINDLNGKEVHLNENEIINKELNITSNINNMHNNNSNKYKNNSGEGLENDSDDDMNSVNGSTSKKQYILKFAPEKQCSQMVCFLPNAEDSTTYKNEESQIVHPLKFAKQLNFIENIVGLPDTEANEQRLSRAYIKVPQKTNLNYTLKTIGQVKKKKKKEKKEKKKKKKKSSKREV